MDPKFLQELSLKVGKAEPIQDANNKNQFGGPLLSSPEDVSQKQKRRVICLIKIKYYPHLFLVMISNLPKLEILLPCLQHLHLRLRLHRLRHRHYHQFWEETILLQHHRHRHRHHHLLHQHFEWRWIRDTSCTTIATSFKWSTESIRTIHSNKIFRFSI